VPIGTSIEGTSVCSEVRHWGQ